VPDGAHNQPYLNANHSMEFFAVERHFLETPQGVGNAEGQLARRAVQSGRRLRLVQQFKEQILKLDVHFLAPMTIAMRRKVCAARTGWP
jgi:hypothetical protein